MENQSELAYFKQRRADFPSLGRFVGQNPAVYLDGPAGTQVPMAVIEAVSSYYQNSNANTHGAFLTTQETDQILAQTRESVAAFLGAPGPETISFGANMTTLNFSLSKAIARSLIPGDEVLVTQLDHEANRGPWLALAEHGVTVREITVRSDGTLDYDDARSKITPKTRLVAMGMASNAFGTVNDVRRIRSWANDVGALLLLDAVHYAPHFPIDVQEVGPDFLLCSAYKFYGPHVGILYTRPGLLEQLRTDRLRTQDEHAPARIETGTLNHASIAGVKAAIQYIASLGDGTNHRDAILSGMRRIGAHEGHLALRLYSGLQRIPGITVRGPSFQTPQRAPTVSFTMDGTTPEQLCARLAHEGIFAWDGHFYAIRPMEMLGLLERGGVTRIGVSLYTMEAEIDRVLSVLGSLARSV